MNLSPINRSNICDRESDPAECGFMKASRVLYVIYAVGFFDAINNFISLYISDIFFLCYAGLSAPANHVQPPVTMYLTQFHMTEEHHWCTASQTRTSRQQLHAFQGVHAR